MKKFIKKTLAGLIAGVMAVSSMPFVALADDVAEITGAVKYGSVIFTYGTNSVSTDYNYLMKGTQIAAGDVKSATDCKTTVSVANGVTINSVSCVEDSSAQLSVSNNVLTGNFSSNHDDSTVTLKTSVTYNGKSYVSYNKVFVDTIPVPAHAASISQRYYGPTNPLKSIMAYSQTLKGSLGQGSSDGSSSSNGVSANAKELFVPGTQVRYDNKNDTNHWRLTNNISLDKVAGYTGYSNSGGWGKGTNTLTTTAPTGYYYFDKSTTDNYGFSAQNGSTFTFDMVTIPFNIVTGDNASAGSVNLDTHTLTGDNFTQTDPYSTFSYDSSTGVPSTTIFTNKITGNASSITSGTMTGSYELRFANNNSSGVWAVNITKSNWNVYVADKTVARNPYNTANSSIKTSDVYTDDSWNAYKTAYLNDEEFLSNYKNVALGTVQATATDLGSALTTAYNNLTLKPIKYTYTFVKADGSQTTVEAENDAQALESKPANTENTKKTYAGEKQHKWVEYSWPTSATNYTFTEQATEKFEACNVVDGKCTICGESFIDYSAFDAAVAEAEALDNSKGVYSDESFAAYQAKVAEIKAKRDTVASQDELDALVAELATASDLLVKTTFTVKFVTVDEKGNESTVEEKTFKYGESYAPTSDKNVEKWVVTTDNGNTTTKLNTFETSVTIIITKDAVVYAYQTDDAQTETSSKVTFYGKNGQIVAVKYVAEGEELETSTVDVPEIPFYTAKGWDKETVTGTGSAISVKAVYESKATEDDMCTVHFGDWSKAYSYDSYVYLPNADTSKKYALYDENDNLLTYLDGVDFYAPKRANIYVKEVTGEVTASIGITGSFSQRTSTTKSAVYNCKFYLPEGATAVEWGLEVTLNGKTAKVKGETKSERNEYSIRLNAPLSSSIDSVDGRAYVTYKTADGTPTTIYSSSVNQTL